MTMTETGIRLTVSATDTAAISIPIQTRPTQAEPLPVKNRVAWKVDLTLEEDVKYKTMINTGYGAGVANIPELLRLLLAREYNRRHGLGQPKPSEWQSCHRTGRPKK